MKINLKTLTIITFSMFAPLVVSSSSLCFGSKFVPYNAESANSDFACEEDCKSLPGSTKESEELPKIYRKSFEIIPQDLKIKYSPNNETYIAPCDKSIPKLVKFVGNIKNLVYPENCFDQEDFVKVFLNTGVIKLRRSYGDFIFDDENWSCTKLPTKSGKGFILLLAGIGKKNKGRTILFNFDPIKFSVNPSGEYNLDEGLRKYNFIVCDILSILNSFRVTPEVADANDITAIDISREMVTKIEKSSFYGRYALKEIKLPATTKSIGANAFEGCTSLKEIELPYDVEKIGERAFDSCIRLTKVKFSNNVKKLGRGCFLNCMSLVEVDIPGSIKEISKAVFACCKSLKKVSISSGVEYIGPNSFENCSNLIQISIPNTVKEIGVMAFSDCYRLSQILLPSSIRKINAMAFSGCSSLRKISIPHSVKEIGTLAFSDCSNLREILISDSVEEIGVMAFNNCSNLREILIPTSVKRIGSKAFINCSKLNEIKYDGKTYNNLDDFMTAFKAKNRC